MVNNVDDLLTKTEPELTVLFANAEAGPIPNGDAHGTAIIAPGTTFTPEIAKFINFFAWQGKIFDAEKMTLVNKITVFGLDAILAHISREPSWIDGKECIVLDYSKTSVVAHWVRDEIRLISPGLYLGRVFWKEQHLIFFALQF
ncbi:hypothetical protein CC77DRAFT_1066430 [Alternaria alternata]|jgi:hypothetical protein|uniref:Uncharacterized protein n=1 Tax=Alternaria alternata TaxID=5599 RepID=A0A177D7E1_ALTAL|nr:hypothetical protein CC77DRAFT_1066430 [Alternaria alternata]OAG15207.1 hypothetical protein CC77DRAFT_1066430 [Alternaria alternata]RII22625.1 hypothetical protein CUC08_Gglean013539 [Alternaria sp. MG1]RYN65498.1 hypothetical protein AA0117_g12157 [Alternaria alternata]